MRFVHFWGDCKYTGASLEIGRGIAHIAPRSATSSAAMSKPSGGIRSLHSLSAWGLPTPIVALAGIGNVIFRCFLVQTGDFYFYGVCKLVNKAPL